MHGPSPSRLYRTALLIGPHVEGHQQRQTLISIPANFVHSVKYFALTINWTSTKRLLGCSSFACLELEVYELASTIHTE